MKIMIVSGHFNPLHVGHLTMLEEGAAGADRLVVIVNNDQQQMLKKGRIIISQDDRLRMVKALRIVDDAHLSVDSDATVCDSIRQVAAMYPDDTLIFGNGGDRDGEREVPESAVCKELGVEMLFDLGTEKQDSSTRINAALEEVDSALGSQQG